MLVLSRKVNEFLRFEVGDVKFTVTVTRVKGNGCKLGVEAPPSVKVIRGELPEKRKGERIVQPA